MFLQLFFDTFFVWSIPFQKNENNFDNIILYDFNLTILRNLEIFQSKKIHEKKLKIYFLIYEKSKEEFYYLNFLQKEKKSFENLILLKENLVISLKDNFYDLQNEYKQDVLLDSRMKNSLFESNNNSSKKSLINFMKKRKGTLMIKVF